MQEPPPEPGKTGDAAVPAGSASPRPAAPPTASPDQPSVGARRGDNLRAACPAKGPDDLAGRTVWVVDSHSLIHQVFHALPEMTSPRGEPVGAVFGFTRDMLYILEQKRPDYLFCAFDLPGRTFRQDLYQPYKIQRPEMDVDLVPQIDTIRRVIETLGIPALGCPGYEADDVLATVAREAQRRGGRCVLVTADKDCRQLLTDWVAVYNIRKDEVFDAARLQEEWGIRPEQVIDFQALVGDAVDNVPGVPLIGPKLARQLLEQYGTLEAVLDHASELSGDETAGKPGEVPRSGAVEPAVGSPRRPNASRHRLGRRPGGQHRRAGGNGAVPGTGLPQLRCKGGWPAERGRGGERERGRFAADRCFPVSPPPPLPPPPLAISPRPSPTVHLVDTPELFEAFLAELRKQRTVLARYRDNAHPAALGRIGGHLAGLGRDQVLVPAAAGTGRRPPPRPGRDLGGRQADSRRPDNRENRAEPEVRHARAPLGRDRVGWRGVRYHGCQLSARSRARNHNLDELRRTYLGREKGKISDLIGTGQISGGWMRRRSAW